MLELLEKLCSIGGVLCESAVSPFGYSTSAMIISSISSIIPSVSLSQVFPHDVLPPDALFSTVLLSLVSDSRALMSAALTCEP